MKVHPAAQGTEEWLNARAGIPCASEIDALISPLGKIRTGEGPKTYLSKKLAEWWDWDRSSTAHSSASFWMEQGRFLEDFAIPWYELEFNTKIERTGFLTTDDMSIGCSPDGLIGEDCGIEIKSPMLETHIKYLLNGEVPSEYIGQVQVGLFVTGRKLWKFVSYRRKLPALIIDVFPNEQFHENLRLALERFHGYFEDGKARLIELNGGPPKRFTTTPDHTRRHNTSTNYTT